MATWEVRHGKYKVELSTHTDGSINIDVYIENPDRDPKNAWTWKAGELFPGKSDG